MDILSPVASTSFGYTSVRQNSSPEESMLKRTVEFMVTTVGGICSGSTISARSSSACSSAVPGTVLDGSDSSNASSLSRSWDVSMICGLLFISASFQVRLNYLRAGVLGTTDGKSKRSVATPVCCLLCAAYNTHKAQVSERCLLRRERD